tara:strand:- start:517 stop:1212 length:696 start_codon:yes stop_codon:yes gene_type:complete
MKVVILAGGLGTRLSEYTKRIPKPMVKIGSTPILLHIIKYYMKFNLNDFIIAGGYKYSIIKNYFKKKKIKKAKIKVINTGLNSLTGKRLKTLEKILTETFMLTYGDGLSNINLNKLYNFHKKNKKKITVTAVHPPARFGEIEIEGNLVKTFQEKPQLQKGWINGGFFVIEPSFFKLIGTKNEMLERGPISRATRKKTLAAYKHEGFWFCMDTVRDKLSLENMLKKKKAPWV